MKLIDLLANKFDKELIARLGEGHNFPVYEILGEILLSSEKRLKIYKGNLIDECWVYVNLMQFDQHFTQYNYDCLIWSTFHPDNMIQIDDQEHHAFITEDKDYRLIMVTYLPLPDEF